MAAKTYLVSPMVRNDPRRASAGGASAERRAARRRTEFLIGGLIISSQNQNPHPCVVRDCGATGARLEIEQTDGARRILATDFPEHITLYLCQTREEAGCRVVWRDGPHLGVEYVTAMRRSKRLPAK